MRKIRVDLDVCIPQAPYLEFYCLGKGCVCVCLPDGRCSAVCPDAVGLWGLWNQEVPSLLAPPSTVF